MSLADPSLTKLSITKFMGQYNRGLLDDCPPDHSPICLNMKFNKNGETSTRDGTETSITTANANKRMFVANTGHEDNGILLTCDGAGNIYRSDTGGILLTVASMVDFVAANIFGFVLISPILSSPTVPNPVYIWQANPLGGSDTVPIRPAAGVGPGLGMTGVEDSNPGNCDIGVHLFGVCWITNTGYTTQPGPMSNPGLDTAENPTFTPVSVTSTGSKSIQLNNIPLGPSGTVARQIICTQSDQFLYYYAGGQIWNGSAFVDWDGTIQDNTTTSIIISFFDTDLAVSADPLFDLLPIIPGGTFSLIAGIGFNNGRTLYWGGEFNLIRLTNPGSAETIDNVAGFIQLPDQFDGNDVTSFTVLQGTLYFFKSTGIFSTTDNGGDPDTWQIINTDNGAGCAHVVSASIPETQDQIALLVDYGGIYLFNGTVIQPPITWKINDLWISIWENTNLLGSMLTIDPYNKLIYVAQVGALSIPGYAGILVADYNDGLDSQNIKWTTWTLPYAINSILMAFFTDSGETAFRFRIGSTNTVYKSVPGLLTDSGTAIMSKWQSYYFAPNPGAVNIFRYLRARMPFQDNISITLYSQDNAFSATPPGFNTPYVNGRDPTREINFMDEKCSTLFTCSASHGGFTLQRLDMFCGVRFAMRPTV